MTSSPVDKFFPNAETRKLMADYDRVNEQAVRSELDRIKTFGDQETITELGASNFPWISPSSTENAMGTMWDADISDLQIELMYDRFQLPPVIIDKPIEEAFMNSFELVNPDDTPKPEEWVRKAMFYWKKDKSSFLRFCKLGLLHGYSLFMFGYQEKRHNWPLPVTRGTNILWTQTVPKPNVQELKITDLVPKRIEYARVSFETDSFQLDHSRFIHIMWPDLVDESTKEGKSFLNNIYNLLQVQNHTDWAIGQGMWRGASGLLTLEAPKKGYSAEEKLQALGSTTNINARTVCYLPHGWKLRNIFTGQGNIAIARTYRTMLEQIAAGSNQPLSVLLGSQKGALSPRDEEDKATYYRWVKTLQENYIQPALAKYFRKYQRAGQIPPGPFEIKWPVLEVKSETQKKREKAINRAYDRIFEWLDDDEKWMKFTPEEIVKLVATKAKR